MNKNTKKQIIEDYILSEISSGRLKIGDQIPSENELVQMFGFGRQTIHNCLNDLSLKGIIDRTPGRGSFIKSKSIKRNITKKNSFTDDMVSMGMKPGSQLLEYKIVEAKDYKEAKENLKLKDNEKMYYIVRLRTGNNIPIALQYSFTPVKFIKDIDLNALSGSFDKYLEKSNINVTGFQTKLKAIEGEKVQLELLHAKEKALLRSASVRYSDQTPIQCTVSYYRSDLFEYNFSSF